MEFSKNLSASEAKYKYLGLPKKTRSFFPDKDEIFQIKFKGKSYKMKVNNKDCIMLSQLYEYHEFHALDFIKIIKNKDTSFSFSVDRNQN